MVTRTQKEVEFSLAASQACWCLARGLAGWLRGCAYLGDGKHPHCAGTEQELEDEQERQDTAGNALRLSETLAALCEAEHKTRAVIICSCVPAV